MQPEGLPDPRTSSGDTIRPVVEVRRPIGNEAWGVVYDHGRAIGVSGVIFDTQGRSNHPLGSFRSQALSLVRFEDGSFSATDELFYPLVIRDMNQDGSTEFVGQFALGHECQTQLSRLEFSGHLGNRLERILLSHARPCGRAPQINHGAPRELVWVCIDENVFGIHGKTGIPKSANCRERPWWKQRERSSAAVRDSARRKTSTSEVNVTV